MESFVLTQVRVRNLACFEDLVLRPGMSTLLLGRNGTGKSTLFDLLFAVKQIVIEGYDVAEAGLPTYQPEAGPARIELELGSSKRRLQYELVLGEPSTAGELTSGAQWVIDEEVLRADGVELIRFAKGHLTGPGVPQGVMLARDRSALHTFQFMDDTVVRGLMRWLGGIWMLRLEPGRMSASSAEPEAALAVSGENFVAWLLGFKRRRRALEEVVEAARGSVDGLKALRFVRAGREDVLVATFDDHDVDFDALSDGQRCLIVLLAVVKLARRDCSLMLLDEPDGYVTSEEILPLLGALEAGTTRVGVQLLVASHHPHVIDLMAPDAPWELARAGRGMVARPFEVDLPSGLSASRYLLLRAR